MNKGREAKNVTVAGNQLMTLIGLEAAVDPGWPATKSVLFDGMFFK